VVKVHRISTAYVFDAQPFGLPRIFRGSALDQAPARSVKTVDGRRKMAVKDDFAGSTALLVDSNCGRVNEPADGKALLNVN